VPLPWQNWHCCMVVLSRYRVMIAPSPWHSGHSRGCRSAGTRGVSRPTRCTAGNGACGSSCGRLGLGGCRGGGFTMGVWPADRRYLASRIGPSRLAVQRRVPARLRSCRQLPRHRRAHECRPCPTGSWCSVAHCRN